jgi:hypothetical protein
VGLIDTKVQFQSLFEFELGRSDLTVISLLFLSPCMSIHCPHALLMWRTILSGVAHVRALHFAFW